MVRTELDYLYIQMFVIKDLQIPHELEPPYHSP